ncbi:MAG: SpoIIE family protein phosphatase [Selenomonadaceae bacterium]|nr:SpoIIE family protein phosphatase [Selenomonadaceae bacterium]
MKSNIRQRVFRLVLSASVLTFLVLVGVALIGMISIRYTLDERSAELSEYSANYIQQTVTERRKIGLQELATAKAQYIDKELTKQSWDAQYLADAMNLELKTPTTGFLARNLAVANYQPIHSGEAYIFYTPELRERGIDAALAEEINRSCNISSYLIPFGSRYQSYFSSFMVAAKNGYFICVETAFNEELIDFDEEFLTSYDFRTRPWYKIGENASSPVFTDVYNDTEGNPSLACVTPYYDGNGNFAGVISISYGIGEIYKIVLDTAVGSDGFSFILNSKGNVILSAKKEGIFSAQEDAIDLRKSANVDLAQAAQKMTEGETGIVSIKIDDEEYYLAYAPMQASGWSFGTLMSYATVSAPAMAARDKILEQMEDFRSSIGQLFFNMLIGSVIMVALLAVWMFIGSSRVSKKFVEPIQQLSEGVREISGGNLDKKVKIDTGDELEELANSVNNMTDELKNYMANLEKVTAAEERIATELKVATNIQLSALPHDFLEDHSEFEIFATMNAAKEVGGDFYDFYLLDENHLMMTIADVSGKGVPAALFMMQGKTILKNLAMTMQSPDDLAAVMALANNQLCQGNDEMMFITVFIAMLDLKTGKLIYVNGGHNPPMLYRDNEKKFSWLNLEQNCVLGLMDEMDFEQQETQMNHGDIIYLYTDGVTEAMNKNREQYGEARLENCLNATNHQCKLQTLLESVSKSLAEHVQDAEQSDDITMLAVRFV